MRISATLRGMVADPDRSGSLADRTRRQRRERLLAAFPDLESMTVLDLGGTIGYWRHLSVMPADLTLVNVTDCGGRGARMIVGDACDPPREALDRSYDLVISNSLIDQVGGLERRRRLASVIRDASDRYWVQTANRGFVIDAYFLFPWFTRLPVAVRTAIIRHWRVSHMHTRDREEARRRVLSIELQSRSDMCALFPDADLTVERFCGHAKSLIAVRSHR